MIQTLACIYKCCCCFDLRTGSIIIAILQIVGFLGTLIYGLQMILDTIDAWSLGVLCLGVLGVAIGICLLIGSIKSNAPAILVYLILEWIYIILLCILGILVSVFSFWGGKGPHIPGLVLGISIIALDIIPIYFWVCVYHFYQLTKYGEITSCA